MHRRFDTYDAIAVVQLPLYFIFTTLATIIFFKHGFQYSAAWRNIKTLCLIRILGSCLRLASLGSATNTGLYKGWVILNDLGMVPLLLMILGVLSYSLASMDRVRYTMVHRLFSGILHLDLLAVMVLVIVGGCKSTFALTSDGIQNIDWHVTSQIAICLVIPAFILLCMETVIALVIPVEGGRRIVFTVVLWLPSVLARIVYRALVVFGSIHSNVWLMLGVEVIPEVIVVLGCEILGLALPPAEGLFDI